jgi:hypothetical protein
MVEGLIANWALIVVIITNGNPVWETIDVFPTQRACFAALERDQLAHDRLPHKGNTERFYRCDAPTEKPGP